MKDQGNPTSIATIHLLFWVLSLPQNLLAAAISLPKLFVSATKGSEAVAMPVSTVSSTASDNSLSAHNVGIYSVG